MPFVATNPLSQRLAVLERLWLEFRRLPNARLCRWLFAPGEGWFLDVFLQEQAGPDAISNDIFITLRTPVQHWQTYFDHALDELSSLIDHDTAILSERNLAIVWTAEPKKNEADFLIRFVDYLNRFVKGLGAHTDGALVLCILPQSTASPAVLDQVLTALLLGKLSPDIRIVVADTIGEEQLATLPGRFGPAVYSHTIDLQLQKVTRQVASLGSPTAPDVKFRQWHAELSNAMTQRNLRDVEYFANNCLLICQQEQWPSLEGSVHLSVAHAYVTHRRYEEALARYSRVIDQMEALFSQGDEAAGRMSIMAWLGAGRVYEELRQRQRAIDSYNLASERAETLKEWLLAIESHRRLGLVQAQESRMRLSETHYRQVFALAEHLPPEQHQLARLSDIGQIYWQQQQTPEKRQNVMELLTQLLGPGWRKS
ncbi:tetratricopeptide repeat protein [Spirosoma radiotolerans]|uniref:MalT-like TPR region domain-containing protein n=1 Tax=Spirosoma radiotolerans TaxID=1379870 RepID=A0A0E3V7P9_9BACT|nr:hypothetical protein [Spirosoma radiotolerans]AKD56062.1 hypothetical protein SD10_15330 [Spirosoma radiotolerans]